jgi:hypothetical protein
MGYLINPNPLSNYKQFVIPFADILIGNYELNSSLAANEYWLCTFASFRLINSTSGVLRGFNDITLGQSGGNTQKIFEMQASDLPGGLTTNSIYTFADSVQLGPTLFGCNSSGPRYLILFNGTYISGDGDIVLDFYYNKVTI